MAHKIALVEDDEKIVHALKVRLQAAGYQVSTAFDPVRGLAMIVKEQPDLILLDLSMPAGGGLLLVERLKKLPSYVMTPIIIITASRQAEPRLKASALGVNEIFEKPFESSDLLAAIARHLGNVSPSEDESKIG